MIPDSVPEQFRRWSDAARRCADTVSLAAIAGCTGRWVAIRLSDGGYDGTLYDSREDAARHQHSPENCTYVLVPPGGMQPHEAEALLDYWRKLRGAGVHGDNQAAGRILMPLTARDRARQIRVLAKGRR